MKIIYLSSTSAGMHSPSIYFDLLEELRDLGNEVTIVYAREARENKETELYHKNGFTYLGIKTGNMTKNKNLVEKTVSTLTIDRAFIKTINEKLKDETFDLLLYSTPPITFDKTIKHFSNQGTFCYLMLKDIFPQNAVDINLFSKHSIPNYYFKKKEKKLYAQADMIGVMSPRNRDFLIESNPHLRWKIEILPNALKPVILDKKYNITDLEIDENDLVLLYGGNLGLPQGIPFILECMKELEEVQGVKLLICGSGSEADKITQTLETKHYKNTQYIGMLPKEDYTYLTSQIDVGLIFLDYRFTVPNFPQRILDYMAAGKPVISATDKSTDVGKIIVQNEFGFSVPSKDPKEWINAVLELRDNPDLRKTMGTNAKTCLEEEYNVSDIVRIILSHF